MKAGARRARWGIAVGCAAAAVALFASASGSGQSSSSVDEGRRLFEAGCAECHGEDARGVPGNGPSLRGVGAAAADFYLRTGRMPLADPHDQPLRSEPTYDSGELDALVDYVAGFGGPPVPHPDATAGDLAEGQRLFTENCAGCHQVVAQGGITTEGVAPQLVEATPTDVAEAIEVGPYVMPRFPQLTPQEVNSIAAYVEYARDPRDVGGWSLGHLGPVPEGMVAWLLAGAALLLVIRLLGEREPR